jgi:hypothetical protein
MIEFKKKYLEWQIRFLKKILGSISVIAIVSSCNYTEKHLKQENDSLKNILQKKEQHDSIELLTLKKDSLEKVKSDSIEKNKVTKKTKHKTKVIPVQPPTYDPGTPVLDYGVYPIQKVEPTLKN